MKLKPKEKAEELVEKYEDALGHSDLNVCPTDDLDVETRATAIQCAIICVNEIINLNLNFNIKCYAYERCVNPVIEFYEKVKEHLKQM